ncbi:hypothetical protein ACJA25_00020 [Mycoplasmopsis hyopharyngis]|uniref:hypothetical protein n=1 Tax=Mycoplasmopsis hyopharyngis TaxID=29558 RepID=UPI0038739E0C
MKKKINKLLLTSLLVPMSLSLFSTSFACTNLQQKLDKEIEKIEITLKKVDKTINQISVNDLQIENKNEKYKFFIYLTKDENKKILFVRYWYKSTNVESKKINKEIKVLK